MTFLIDGEPSKDDVGARLEKIVLAIAISPEDAKELVDKYRRRYGYDKSGRSRSRIAKAIVRRFAALSAGVGGAAALPGVVPGIGDLVAVIGGGAIDAAFSLKLQVDMCLCLAEVYHEELSNEDKRTLGMVIALAGTAEKLAVGRGGKVVEAAVIRVIVRHLRGPALVATKELFKKIGILFTRAALVKAIPLGIGVALSASTNYALTLVVGNIAVKLFEDVPDPLGRSTTPAAV